jgi:hypothetical protein
MGKNTQLKKQIGEALVVAELGKRGCIATSFAGNVSGFDIVAINPKGQVKIVQVKSIRNNEWHGKLPDIFFEITLGQDNKQRLCGYKKQPKGLIWVFVGTKNEPVFYICNTKVVREVIKNDYFTESSHTIRSKRPKSPESHHHAIKDMDDKFKQYKGKWELICGREQKNYPQKQRIKNR